MLIDKRKFARALGYLAVGAVVSGAWQTQLHAQQYPSKPIRFVSPFAPGGGNDVISRTVAAKVSENVKQQVIVDNRAGANGIVGTEIAARSAPDGYTIVLIPSGHTVNASLYRKLPYDAIRDFTPITLVGSSPLVIVVHPSLPVKTVKELVYFVQARPDQVPFSSAGIGSSGHLAGALFDTLTGTKLVHVPYKGNSVALTDLIGGQVVLNFATSASVMAHVKAGRLRALATTGASRSPSLPDLPTIAESGVKDYETGLWYAFVGPAGMPKEIVQRLNAELVAAIKSPEVHKRLVSVGVDPNPGTPDELAKLMASDLKRWAAVIARIGLKPQ